MPEGFTRREKARLQDHRLWRLLLARLHPDAGGDGELFLFACALREGVGGRQRPHNRPGPDHTFTAWRGGMDSWASRNRDRLGGPRRRSGR